MAEVTVVCTIVVLEAELPPGKMHMTEMQVQTMRWIISTGYA